MVVIVGIALMSEERYAPNSHTRLWAIAAGTATKCEQNSVAMSLLCRFGNVLSKARVISRKHMLDRLQDGYGT